MNREQFIEFQRSCAFSMIASLLRECERRYLDAAELLENSTEVVRRIREAHFRGGTNMAPLWQPWDILCVRYERERCDSQMLLFSNHSDHIRARWTEFVHWQLIPVLVRDNAVVRNVLRGVAVLPCDKPPDAIDALCEAFSEMPLPDAAPLREVEEM